MKKPILFFLLVCSVTISFSQKRITNKSHPFQVLFSSDASTERRLLKQFDFVEKNEVISCDEESVLIHYTGEIITLKDTITDLKKINKALREKVQHRPFIDPKKKHLPLQYSMHSCFRQTIEILHPRETETVVEHSNTLPFFTAWKTSETTEEEFLILIRSIYDDPIGILKTSNNYINIDLSKYKVKDKFLVYSIILARNRDIRSSDIGIKLKKQNSKNDKYRLMLSALENDVLNQEKIASHFYQASIKESNQDPRFIQLYEDFLERNPQFKE